MEIKIVPLKKWMVFGSAVVLLIALGMFLTIPLGAEASSVSCGDVLVADSILTKDLKCKEDPALTVVGPAKLDMNGHTLTCKGGLFGILVDGRGAEVSNGTIKRCGDNGVHVFGDGGHTISDLTITDSGDDGVDVDSNGNTLEGLTVTGSPDKGILIDEFTHGNMVINNTLTGNKIGIETDIGASGNIISGNTATGNTEVDLLDDGITETFVDCDNNWKGNTFGSGLPVGCIN